MARIGLGGFQRMTIELLKHSNERWRHTFRRLLLALCLFTGMSTAYAQTALSPATVGEYYSVTINISAGHAPYDLALVAGQLPPGLTLEAPIGEQASIVGLPYQTGVYNFTLRFSGTAGYVSNEAYSISVAPAPLDLRIPSLPPWTAPGGMAYSRTLTATGGSGPLTWSSSGTLPPCLTLAADGTLSGTPNTVGTWTFTVSVTDGVNTANADYTVIVTSITITAPASPLTIVAGAAYSQTLSASGGLAPYFYSVVAGSLPPGLMLSSGALSGTATQLGAFNFTLQRDGFAPDPQARKRIR